MANYIIESSISYLPLRKKHDSYDLPLNKKYRSSFEIIALILESVKDNNEARFSIMKHASINCAQLKKFLNWLVETGFIEMERKEGRVSYKASDKGLAFLRQYYVLLGILLTPRARSKAPRILCEPRLTY
jgi:predicted transcriptional regulator